MDNTVGFLIYGIPQTQALEKWARIHGLDLEGLGFETIYAEDVEQGYLGIKIGEIQCNNPMKMTDLAQQFAMPQSTVTVVHRKIAQFQQSYPNAPIVAADYWIIWGNS